MTFKIGSAEAVAQGFVLSTNLRNRILHRDKTFVERLSTLERQNPGV